MGCRDRLLDRRSLSRSLDGDGEEGQCSTDESTEIFVY